MSALEQSAIDFTRMWCELFVGESPDIPRAMQYFIDDASILIPSLPYRLRRADDEQEITFSHLVDGCGHVHFWQVLEPAAIVHGDVAVVSYYARYNVGRKGESAVKCAKESLVLVRSGDDWRIIHMHNSAI
jgi:ketosteroid isomerase-like protein